MRKQILIARNQRGKVVEHDPGKTYQVILSFGKRYFYERDDDKEPEVALGDIVNFDAVAVVDHEPFGFELHAKKVHAILERST